MTYAEMCGAVETLDKKYDERNPFRLCRAMGIKLIFQPMGKDPDAVKGFFLESKRIRTITVNSDLPEIIQRIIVAHEICHAMFHRKSGIHAFHEVALFDQNSVLEKEANLFAAEFLLSDESVFPLTLYFLIFPLNLLTFPTQFNFFSYFLTFPMQENVDG